MKDISMDSYRVQHTHTTRNTDTITNTTVRKLTSIALMAIMVGGGLTFAIPGMEPAYAAQVNSNPNLKVSAEGQNTDNEIASTNIVQVVIIDDLKSDTTDSMPIVTVGGDQLFMYQSSGAWYAYFANDDIATLGLLPGVAVGTASSATELRDLVTNAAPIGTPANPNNNEGATTDVQLFDLDGEFDIVYERPNGDQTVSMELDDPDVSVGLDRNNYPQNTDVVITIDDISLNVDPTGADEWWINNDGAVAFYIVGLSGPDTDPTGDQLVPFINLSTISEAQIDRAERIAEATQDRDNAIRDAAADRDKAKSDAREAFKDINDAAKAALKDVLLPQSEIDRINNLVDTEQWKRDYVVGQGDRNDGAAYPIAAAFNADGELILTQVNEVGTTPATDLPEHWIGTADYEYELVVGGTNDAGQRQDGNAQKAFDWVNGQTGTAATPDAAITPALGDDTDNDGIRDNDLDSNGVPDTLENTDATTDGRFQTAPVGYVGTAELEYLAAIA